MFGFLLIVAIIIFLIIRKNPHKKKPANGRVKKTNPAKKTSSNVSPTISVPCRGAPCRQ